MAKILSGHLRSPQIGLDFLSAPREGSSQLPSTHLNKILHRHARD